MKICKEAYDWITGDEIDKWDVYSPLYLGQVHRYEHLSCLYRQAQQNAPNFHTLTFYKDVLNERLYQRLWNSISFTVTS